VLLKSAFGIDIGVELRDLAKNMSNNSNDIPIRNRLVTMGSQFKTPVIILGGFVILIWFLELIDWIILDGALDGLGVKPRSLAGLKGILFMPFLHGGFGHLLSNTIPFIVLGALVMLSGLRTFLTVAGLSILVSGVGVWLFGGGNSVHIGASGLVFGLFGFLITRAYFERSISAIVIAFAVLVFYGGILWGLLPFWLGVSWLGHLFGFAGGVIAAYWLSKRREV
jgi:membrane associated rhomboid family serine protease